MRRKGRLGGKTAGEPVARVGLVDSAEGELLHEKGEHRSSLKRRRRSPCLVGAGAWEKDVFLSTGCHTPTAPQVVDAEERGGWLE